MALEGNQNGHNNSIAVNEPNPSYDELFYALEELHEDMKKLCKKNTI